MEDIMIIRSSFMRRIISQIINKALKKQMPGVEVELKDIQANWLDKEQKVHLHLELDADVTKAQLNDILKNAGVRPSAASRRLFWPVRQRSRRKRSSQSTTLRSRLSTLPKHRWTAAKCS